MYKDFHMPENQTKWVDNTSMSVCGVGHSYHGRPPKVVTSLMQR